MPDTKTIKLAALWIAGLALVGLSLAGVGSLVLSMDSGFGTVTDLEVTNEGSETVNVTVEATPANDSRRTFARTAALAPNQSISAERALADGEEYELTVTVADGPSETWTITGPGGACGVRVAVGENVTMGRLCA